MVSSVDIPCHEMEQRMTGDDLTTAESLVLELLVAHRILGAQPSRLPRGLWIRPQLERLEDLGLLRWTFDSAGDFEVRADDHLLHRADARAMAARLLEGLTAPAVSSDSVTIGATRASGAVRGVTVTR